MDPVCSHSLSLLHPLSKGAKAWGNGANELESDWGCVSQKHWVRGGKTEEGRKPLVSRSAIRAAGQEPGTCFSAHDLLLSFTDAAENLLEERALFSGSSVELLQAAGAGMPSQGRGPTQGRLWLRAVEAGAWCWGPLPLEEPSEMLSENLLEEFKGKEGEQCHDHRDL